MDFDDSMIKHTNHKLLDQPLIRLPHELLRNNFRLAHFHIEREHAILKAALREAASASVSGRATPVDSLRSLDAVLARLRSARTRLAGLADDEAALHRSLASRAVHLDDLHHVDSVDDRRYEAWSRRRLDRLLVDYMLRMGYFDTARALAADREIEDLVDIDAFVTRSRISDALRAGSVTEALQWTSENKKELRKMDCNLEFLLRFQQYVELIRAQPQPKITEAIAHARKYILPFKHAHPDAISQACLLIVLPPSTASSLVASNSSPQGSASTPPPPIFPNTNQTNSGQINSGQANSGQVNSGQVNSGQANSGQDTSGQDNSGQDNSGRINSIQTDSNQANSGKTDPGQTDSDAATATSSASNDKAVACAALYSPARWDMLADVFTRTYNDLLALPSVPLLHIALSSGLSALKVRVCHPEITPTSSTDKPQNNNTNGGGHGNGQQQQQNGAAVPNTENTTTGVSDASVTATATSTPARPSPKLGRTVCPVCSAELHELSRHVPYAHHTRSQLESDQMLLPNGYAYGLERLLEQARKAGLPPNQVQDLRTGEAYEVATLRKVYIS